MLISAYLEEEEKEEEEKEEEEEEGQQRHLHGEACQYRENKSCVVRCMMGLPSVRWLPTKLAMAGFAHSVRGVCISLQI
jgi:hypothetical protein